MSGQLGVHIENSSSDPAGLKGREISVLDLSGPKV